MKQCEEPELISLDFRQLWVRTNLWSSGQQELALQTNALLYY